METISNLLLGAILGIMVIVLIVDPWHWFRDMGTTYVHRLLRGPYQEEFEHLYREYRKRHNTKNDFEILYFMKRDWEIAKMNMKPYTSNMYKEINQAVTELLYKLNK